MSGGKSRKKKNSGKVIKLPNGATQLKRCADSVKNAKVDEKVVEFVKTLAESEWEPFSARPKTDITGFYLICRWYPRDSTWVILYAGYGHIHACLDHHFGGHERTPIGNYLSSFTKEARSLIWLKWQKEPAKENIRLEDVLEVLAEMYSSSNEKPPFNLDLELESETVPEDFSIVPDWNKPPRKRGKAIGS